MLVAFPDSRLLPPLRILQHEVRGVADFRCGYILRWNGPIVLPRYFRAFAPWAHEGLFLGEPKPLSSRGGSNGLQAYFILGGSLVSEGATWLVAFNSIRKGAREINMSVKDYSRTLHSQARALGLIAGVFQYSAGKIPASMWCFWRTLPLWWAWFWPLDAWEFPPPLIVPCRIRWVLC